MGESEEMTEIKHYIVVDGARLGVDELQTSQLGMARRLTLFVDSEAARWAAETCTEMEGNDETYLQLFCHAYELKHGVEWHVT